MNYSSKFKYNSTPTYTALPCYRSTMLYPSLDSSGMATSIQNNWPYWPARSTYGIMSI